MGKKLINSPATRAKSDIELDYAELRKAVLVLRAVNHKLRQKIMELLEENEKMTVTSLYVKLRIEQSVASQHLAILRRAGVVATEREGKFIHYRVDKTRIADIAAVVEMLNEGTPDAPPPVPNQVSLPSGVGLLAA